MAFQFRPAPEWEVGLLSYHHGEFVADNEADGSVELELGDHNVGDGSGVASEKFEQRTHDSTREE